MGLRYENLDDVTRHFMLDEIAMDDAAEKLYLSTYLTQSGQGQWADLLKDAARSGSDVSLAVALSARGMFLHQAMKKKPSGGYTYARVPYTAPQTLAEGEFNRFYIRALCRRAIAEQIPKLEVYRAKEVDIPRSDSKYKIGNLVDPATVLMDARAAIGMETALGMPHGPNSGLTLRIPLVAPLGQVRFPS